MSDAFPTIHLIWAQARQGVIGKDGLMPWHLPEDLAHFKAHTQGQPVVMGRKTWDSLPERFRPLPGRRNVVISRNTDWHAAGAERAGSLQEALELCLHAGSVWVIGGAQIYAQALPLAQSVVVTEIDADFAGDAYAPHLGAQWQPYTQTQWHTSHTGLRYRFVHYTRAYATTVLSPGA